MLMWSLKMLIGLPTDPFGCFHFLLSKAGFGALVLTVTVLHSVPNPVFAQTVSELRDVLSERERLFSSFSVRLKVTGESSVGGPVRRYTRDESVSFSGEKWYYERIEHNSNWPKPRRDKGAYDGKLYSFASGDEAWTQGVISLALSGAPPSDITNYLHGGAGMGYSSALVDGETVLETTDGLIRFSSPKMEGPVVSGRPSQLWVELSFDPKLNFALVSQKRNYETGGDSGCLGEITASSFQQLSNGLFVPSQGQVRLEDPNSKEVLSESIDFSDWTFPSQRSTDSYQVEFSPGTLVTDQRVGKTFRAIELTDWKISAEVERGDKLTSKHSWLWFLFVVVLLLVGTFVGWRTYSKNPQ
jgi:hypothetical protein